MSVSFRVTAEARFSLWAVVEAYMRIYDRALATARSARGYRGAPLGMGTRRGFGWNPTQKGGQQWHQATLLNAFAELLRAVSDLSARVRLAIVSDRPLPDTLRDLANCPEVAHLIWLPGACTNIPEVLRVFHMLMLLSLAEGIPNTILEAMSTSLPVLATWVTQNSSRRHIPVAYPRQGTSFAWSVCSLTT